MGEETLIPSGERVPPTSYDEKIETISEKECKMNNSNNNQEELGCENNNKIEYNPKIKWPDLTVQLFIHLGCVYGFYLILTQAKFLTTLWGEYFFNKTF